MKLLLLISLLLQNSVFATVRPTDSTFNTKLTAQKGSKKQSYIIGQDVVIWYSVDDKQFKQKGFIKSISNDSITLLSFNKKKQTQHSVAIKDIDAVSKAYYKVQKVTNIVSLIVAGIGIPVSISSLFTKDNIGSFSILAFIVFIGFAIELFIIVSSIIFLVGLFSKKSKKKGWQFRVE